MAQADARGYAVAQIELRQMEQGDPIPDSHYDVGSYGVNRITTQEGTAAYIAGQLVGVITYTVRPEGDWSSTKPADRLPHTFVHWVYTYPATRTKGVGSALLDHVCSLGLPLKGELENEWMKANWHRWSS
jgi:GNAT superfamily N-acetyltransferase